ncbi:MAG: AAA family ATPase [Nanoarchaeota archaeon]
MPTLIFIRGAPAVGKTTTTKALLHRLKTENGKDCAYICEDNFRKQLQYKYKARDQKTHEISAELIQSLIRKLVSLDSYDYIFIEGQFRYPEIIEKYEAFAKDHHFKRIWFQFELDVDTMKQRDTARGAKSPDIEEVKSDIDKHTPPYCTVIQTNQPEKGITEEVLDRIIAS